VRLCRYLRSLSSPQMRQMWGGGLVLVLVQKVCVAAATRDTNPSEGSFAAFDAAVCTCACDDKNPKICHTAPAASIINAQHY